MFRSAFKIPRIFQPSVVFMLSTEKIFLGNLVRIAFFQFQNNFSQLKKSSGDQIFPFLTLKFFSFFEIYIVPLANFFESVS